MKELKINDFARILILSSKTIINNDNILFFNISITENISDNFI